MKPTVLIVEDDADLGSLLKQYLELNGFAAHLAGDGQQARALLRQQPVDLLLTDVMMPVEDGFTLAAQVKQLYPDLPFLFITARKLPEDVRKGLTLGADDYITKPFDADELVLRIQNILRRTRRQAPAPPAEIALGCYTFSLAELTLRAPGSHRALTEKEGQLLHYLWAQQGQLLKRTDVLNHLWGDDDFFKGRSLDVFISRLRKYLAADPALTIENVRGVGFRLRVGEGPAAG